jgi:glycosyltransferase involved in cell wall biosynthesis
MSIYNTFIIPTMGRNSLRTAIKSALTQDNTHIVVVSDNVELQDIINNTKITYIQNKYSSGSAGLVRNCGIEYALSNIQTEYISFLDDDDYITNNFTDVLKLYSTYDLLIHSISFLYHEKEIKQLPFQSGFEIERGRMGIAMSVKAKILKDKNIKFGNSVAEDFFFAKTLITNGATYYNTGIVTYVAPSKGEWNHMND